MPRGVGRQRSPEPCNCASKVVSASAESGMLCSADPFRLKSKPLWACRSTKSIAMQSVWSRGVSASRGRALFISLGKFPMPRGGGHNEALSRATDPRSLVHA